MEMTKVSTLSVPEIDMSADPTHWLCGCQRRFERGGIGADLDDVLMADSTTASGACDFLGWHEAPDAGTSGACSCQIIKALEQRATLPLKQRQASRTINLDLGRFLKQAAVSLGSVGVFSTGLLGPAQAAAATPQMAKVQGLPLGTLPRWLRSIADDELSRPIIEPDELNGLWLACQADRETTEVAGNDPLSSLRLSRVPTGAVKSIRLPAEVFIWDEVEYRMELAVEKFYEPENADSQNP